MVDAGRVTKRDVHHNAIADAYASKGRELRGGWNAIWEPFDSVASKHIEVCKKVVNMAVDVFRNVIKLQSDPMLRASAKQR
eukprot:15087499-Alexandrium_andersonii.AAC.1